MKERRKKKSGRKELRKAEDEENTIEQELLFEIWIDTKMTKNLLHLLLEDIEDLNNKLLCRKE